MSPEAAALWMLPAHSLQWTGLILGGLALLAGLLLLLEFLRELASTGRAIDEEDEP
jgi:hypothetical protein